MCSNHAALLFQAVIQRPLRFGMGLGGSGELAATIEDPILLNHALYQFEWYRRLMGRVYPHVPGVEESIEVVLAANANDRPVFFTEPVDSFDEERNDADRSALALSLNRYQGN